VAESDNSQHAAAFVGHLLTNPAARAAAEAAAKLPKEQWPDAITKVINDHLGTNLSTPDGLAVAKDAKERLNALKLSPQTVSAAEANIIAP